MKDPVFLTGLCLYGDCSDAVTVLFASRGSMGGRPALSLFAAPPSVLLTRFRRHVQVNDIIALRSTCTYQGNLMIVLRHISDE